MRAGRRTRSGQPGLVAEHGAQVRGRGGGGGHGAGRPGRSAGRSGRRLAREWFPELADTRLRQVTWPAIEAHRDYIVAQLEAGVTVATIHQRLRDEQGLAVSVASLRRYVAANLPEEVRRAQVRVLRLAPGRGRERGPDRLRAAGPVG